MRFRIEGFDLNLHILMLNSHCVTPAAVIVTEFFMILWLQMTIFLFFFFFFYFINKKTRK